MANQKWKTDPALYNAPTEKNGVQTKKKLDYDTTYRHEFLDADPLRDWESIERCKWLWEWALEQIEFGGLECDPTKWSVLDVGTKDAQFPEWLTLELFSWGSRSKVRQKGLPYRDNAWRSPGLGRPSIGWLP